MARPPGKRDRRQFLASTAASGALALTTLPALGRPQAKTAEISAERWRAAGAEPLHARTRTPLSFVIDDSTCLVNMGRYCMPQFATAWPARKIYRKPWRTWPREIPDTFVREFADFCEQQGVRGKYSVVPYPACVGWLDRELPDWSRRALLDSLRLVRERVAPRFDIHPEMITHTRVIDLKTGRPLAEINADTMENSHPGGPVSVDYLASYLAYALRVLKNCGLHCDGVTTPGGFGNRVKSELGLAVFEAVRDVFGTDLPHYFKYIVSDDDTEARLEHVREADSDSPRLVANVPAATGDWFGGWDGDRVPEGPRYANEDATAGRLVELIERGKPAVMLCHWPGLYNHGAKTGLRQFQAVVRALNARFGDSTQWMKLSQIGRQQAARQLTRPDRVAANRLKLQAPFACSDFTLRLALPASRPTKGPIVQHAGADHPLREVRSRSQLVAGTWLKEADHCVVCWDLAKGESQIVWPASENDA